MLYLLDLSALANDPPVMLFREGRLPARDTPCVVDGNVATQGFIEDHQSTGLELSKNMFTEAQSPATAEYCGKTPRRA
jgi:hypothetical protein